MFEPDRQEVISLISAAVRAPSADNRHHARFAIVEGGLEVWADAFFDDRLERHRRLLTLISFGAIAENLRLVLSTRGMDYRPDWFPDPDRSSLLLHIRWNTLGKTTADSLADAIVARHTNRHFYRGPRLSVAERTAIEAAMPASGVRLEWFDAPDRRRRLLRLIRLAETARFRDRRLHAEMFDSIAFDAGWHRSTIEDLAPATLGVEPFLRVPFSALRHWRVMRVLNALGAHRMLGLRAGDLPSRLSPHLAALTSTLPADIAALTIGGAFQRVWLAAERAGLALQPMVASAILATDDAPDRGIGEQTRQRLQRGWHDLVGEAKPMIVFRLGRARRPTVVAGRRPAEDYLLA